MESATNKPTVGVVVVNHDAKELLRATLLSIHAQEYDVFAVVSDNASKDGSCEMVLDEFKDVTLLKHDPEIGYAAAANAGIRFMVYEECVDYVFSTTNDVELKPDIITQLVLQAEADKTCGVLGCKIYFHDRPTTIWHAGGVVSPWHGHTRHRGWNRKDEGQWNDVVECCFVTGCGILMRSSALKEVGLFRDAMAFYSEDVDLCFRMRKAGYKVVYVPTAVMWHKTGTTLAKNRPVQLRYSTRNQLFVIEEHRIGYRYPWTIFLNLLVVCPVKMLYFICDGTPKNAVGIWQGIKDWMLGVFGMIKQ